MNQLRKFKFTVFFNTGENNIYWEYSLNDLEGKLLQYNLYFKTVKILDENDEVVFERDL
jgi:hypothetical protein